MVTYNCSNQSPMSESHHLSLSPDGSSQVAQADADHVIEETVMLRDTSWTQYICKHLYMCCDSVAIST